jgi:3-hydroxyacyl-CoA dehydrogenase
MLSAGCESFYQVTDGRVTGVYNPQKGKYDSLPQPPSIILLKNLKAEGRVIARNPSASLIDLGDGVACVEFHTKMNALDQDIGQMVAEGLKRTAAEFEGLVIGNDAENFSAGANLLLIALNAQAGQWDQLENIVEGLQDLHMAIRYSPRPVVVAPAGLTLGGGAEMMMHASRVVAAAELYTGLVEVGMGLIPAGGGTKEMVRRLLNPPMRTRDVTDLAFLQRLFEQVGQAKVAMSAEEARQLGMLGPEDRVIMSREHLLAEAKREVLHLAAGGYHPPIPEKIYAAGRDGLAALRLGIYTFREGNYITEYEAVIGEKLAYVMTGGEISQPAWVPEQYLLDLEREAFLSLCGEEKTQQRIWNFLQTGKPLRN